MSSLCTEALNQCVLSAHFAQSAIVQCSLINSQLTKPVNVIENNTYHSISVFSELGLGVSTATLFDPLHWKKRIKSANKDAIAKNNIMSSAADGSILFNFILSIVISQKWRYASILAPIATIIASSIPLFSMAGFWHIGDRTNFYTSVASFIASLIVPVLLLEGNNKTEEREQIVQNIHVE